jgi:basic membrane protein A and related proteins
MWGAMFMNGEAEMPYDHTLSRRALLRSAALTTTGWWAAAVSVRAANPTVVGFIYVGPRDDFGYNQAHAQGAAAVVKMLGVKVVEEEKVPETADVQKTMGSMVTLDGATLLFPTSFGYFRSTRTQSRQAIPEGDFFTCRKVVSGRQTSQKC